MRSHKDLDAWKLSRALVTRVYAVTRTFPEAEAWGAHGSDASGRGIDTFQHRRGCGQRFAAGVFSVLRMALGSAAELETQILLTPILFTLRYERVRKWAAVAWARPFGDAESDTGSSSASPLAGCVDHDWTPLALPKSPPAPAHGTPPCAQGGVATKAGSLRRTTRTV